MEFSSFKIKLNKSYSNKPKKIKNNGKTKKLNLKSRIKKDTKKQQTGGGIFDFSKIKKSSRTNNNAVFLILINYILTTDSISSFLKIIVADDNISKLLYNLIIDLSKGDFKPDYAKIGLTADFANIFPSSFYDLGKVEFVKATDKRKRGKADKLITPNDNDNLEFIDENNVVDEEFIKDIAKKFFIYIKLALFLKGSVVSEINRYKERLFRLIKEEMPEQLLQNKEVINFVLRYYSNSRSYYSSYDNRRKLEQINRNINIAKRRIKEYRNPEYEEYYMKQIKELEVEKKALTLSSGINTKVGETFLNEENKKIIEMLLTDFKLRKFEEQYKVILNMDRYYKFKVLGLKTFSSRKEKVLTLNENIQVEEIINFMINIKEGILSYNKAINSIFEDKN